MRTPEAAYTPPAAQTEDEVARRVHSALLQDHLTESV
jgi:hypothetical protein